MHHQLAIGLCLLAVVAAWSAEPVAAVPARAHVVILVIDGARWSETGGDAEHRSIPELAKLLPAGSLGTAFRNQGVTETNAGHTALTTGCYQAINNSGQELPAHASLFQRYLAATKAPTTDAWVIASKDKLAILADSADPAWHGVSCPAVDCGQAGLGSGYRDDDATMRRVEAVLAQHHPHLLLINLRGPDSAGHSNDWAAYLAAIRSCDGFAAGLWQRLQADPLYAGQTVLFVTNDHGRHLDGHRDGFVSHGDDCDGCRHVMLFAIGAGIRQGLVSNKPRGLTDIPVTAAKLLGVELSGATGQVMDELLSGP